MSDKLISPDYAVSLAQDGYTLAFGGNVLYRSPVKIAKKLALAGKQGLHLVKTAVALEADILCGAACVSTVSAGFVGYEINFGLCHFYRKAAESGIIKAEEHSCYSVITALRASVQGVPFLPIRGMLGSDLMEAIGFKTVIDPYSGEELAAIRAICPDIAFIHVQKADKAGNAEIIGPTYEDLIVARSAKMLIISCEELVDDDYFGLSKKANISQVLTDHVVYLPGGAKPGACEGYYDVDEQEMQCFKNLKTPEELMRYLRDEEKKE